MRESLKRLKPDRFEDIIAMVALYRPGPMDNIPTYINRKHGEEPVDYLHPMLEGILKETYGVIIYQEQVMQIAQVMAGYSLGEADLLRRAMGKKDKNEMAKQQALFVEGALKNGVKKDDAVYIFELVDKFAGYGFNKIARRRLRAGQLSHGLSQGQLPRGVLRRVDDARHGQHRQARHVCGRGRQQRHRDQAAVHQCLRRRFPARATVSAALATALRGAGRRARPMAHPAVAPRAESDAPIKRRYPLFAGGVQEHRLGRRRDDRRRAPRQGGLPLARRFCDAAQSQGAEQARHRDARARPARSIRSTPIAPRSTPTPTA